jgi:DNA modification methylase
MIQRKLANEEEPNGAKGKVDRRNSLNDLTGKEWIQETVSFWFQRGLGKAHPETAIERQHPAPFPYMMIERLLKMFTKKGDRVLDPFVGVGSTLKACELNGRTGVGVELSEKWLELARTRLEKEAAGGKNQQLVLGDSRTALKGFDSESFDFVVTSPPYWSILNKPADHRVTEERLKQNLETNYSTSIDDLGNIKEYPTFLTELRKVFGECFRLLRRGRYMVVVVADFRHKSRYVLYHADVCRMMEELGFTSKGITIYLKNAKKLYPYGYPFDYVPNIHHEYILIFKKENGNAF